MGMFTLKSRDTYPVLEVALKNPNGTPHDLTGATGYELHIKVSGDLVLVRDMELGGLPTTGVLRYPWVETDWAEGNLPLVSVGKTKDLPMEYEVTGGPAGRLTFPNNGTDTLRIVGDLA